MGHNSGFAIGDVVDFSTALEGVTLLPAPAAEQMELADAVTSGARATAELGIGDEELVANIQSGVEDNVKRGIALEGLTKETRILVGIATGLQDDILETRDEAGNVAALIRKKYILSACPKGGMQLENSAGGVLQAQDHSISVFIGPTSDTFGRECWDNVGRAWLNSNKAILPRTYIDRAEGTVRVPRNGVTPYQTYQMVCSECEWATTVQSYEIDNRMAWKETVRLDRDWAPILGGRLNKTVGAHQAGETLTEAVLSDIRAQHGAVEVSAVTDKVRCSKCGRQFNTGGFRRFDDVIAAMPALQVPFTGKVEHHDLGDSFMELTFKSRAGSVRTMSVVRDQVLRKFEQQMKQGHAAVGDFITAGCAKLEPNRTSEMSDAMQAAIRQVRAHGEFEGWPHAAVPKLIAMFPRNTAPGAYRPAPGLETEFYEAKCMPAGVEFRHYRMVRGMRNLNCWWGWLCRPVMVGWIPVSGLYRVAHDADAMGHWNPGYAQALTFPLRRRQRRERADRATIKV
jgi:hypothetical protein